MRRALLVLVALVVLAVAAQAKKEDVRSVLAEVASEHPVRTSTRMEDGMDEMAVNRADLFFRAADKDYDKHVSLKDLQDSEELVQKHLPGVSPVSSRGRRRVLAWCVHGPVGALCVRAQAHLSSFIQTADKDGDGKLSRNEFVQALAVGSSALVEVDAQRRRTGFLKAGLKRVRAAAATSRRSRVRTRHARVQIGKAVAGKAKEAVRKIKGAVDTKEDACVMCQYIVERLEVSVKAAGIFGPASNNAPAGSIMLETAAAAKQVRAPRSVAFRD